MRVVVRVLLVVVLLTVGAAPVSAAKPARGCPNDGFTSSTKDAFRDVSRALGVPEELLGEPLDLWWADSDKNGNTRLCIKDLPETPGLPVFVFNIVDDVSNH